MVMSASAEVGVLAPRNLIIPTYSAAAQDSLSGAHLFMSGAELCYNAHGEILRITGAT